MVKIDIYSLSGSSSGKPSFSFNSDSDTGIYYNPLPDVYDDLVNVDLYDPVFDIVLKGVESWVSAATLVFQTYSTTTVPPSANALVVRNISVPDKYLASISNKGRLFSIVGGKNSYQGICRSLEKISSSPVELSSIYNITIELIESLSFFEMVENARKVVDKNKKF